MNRENRESVSPAVLYRLGLAVGLLLISSACGSTGGCQGCATQPIPGGFDQQHRFDNAMQVRLSSSGISFLETNFESLVNNLIPGGLSFTIPPTGCSSDQKVCCKSSAPPCDISIDINNVQITPTPKSTAKLALRAKIKTGNPINFSIKLLFYTLECTATYDSAASGKSDLGLNADVDFLVDPNNDNKLSIKRGATTVSDFDSGDIDISGGVDCTIASWFKSLFKSQIESQLMSAVDDTVDGMLQQLPLGQEGRFDFASFLASFSPGTTGVMDYFLWAGGYSAAENAGMSLGVMGGFRAAKHNPCVPDCEAAGASCQAPQKTAIPRSQVFRTNTRPNNQPFDVGIGVHRQTLDVAAYGMYSSGGLCLDVGTQTVSQLSSSMFGLLVPSLNVLTGGNNVPMKLSIRPRQPPTVTLGKGTYHKDASGKVVIDDPLIKVNAKDFAADVYVLVDERYIRVFTIVGDLEMPVLLYPDSDGKLQPILGDLSKALTNIKVENDDLITEDPNTLASVFPTLMGLAASFLAGGFEPIALPSLQGIELQFGPGSITTTDNNDVLAIFTDLALVQTTSGELGAAGMQVDTDASLDSMELPDRLGPGLDPAHAPAAVLKVGARLPAALQGKPVEYAYRVDGGFLHPFRRGERLVVTDPLLWLQGRHTVEVVARTQDAPGTLDPTPARVELTIDTVPPAVRLIPTADGVRAEVQDAVTPADQVQLSWSLDGGRTFGPFGHTRLVEVPEGTDVAVKARDVAGNVAMDSLISGVVIVEDQAQGGCSVGSPASPALPVLGLLALLGLITLRRR